MTAADKIPEGLAALSRIAERTPDLRRSRDARELLEAFCEMARIEGKAAAVSEAVESFRRLRGEPL